MDLRVPGTTPTKVKYNTASTTDVFDGLGTGSDTSTFGTGANLDTAGLGGAVASTSSIVAANVPGSSINSVQWTHAINANSTLDVNIQNAPKKRPIRLDIFVQRPIGTTQTGFWIPGMDVRFAVDSGFTGNWSQKIVPLHLGMNSIVIGGGYTAFGGASELPSGEFNEGSGGTLATLNASGTMWDGNVRFARFRVAGGGAGRAGRYNMVSMETDVDNIPQLALVFDDQYRRVFLHAKDVLNSRGIYFAIAVIGSLIGSDAGLTYMTKTQLLETIAAGNETLNHTFNHFDATAIATKTRVECDDEIRRNEDLLGAEYSTKGNCHKILVTPQGADGSLPAATWRQAISEADINWSLGTCNRGFPRLRQRNMVPRVWIDTVTTFGGVAPTIDQIIQCLWSNIVVGNSQICMLHDILNDVGPSVNPLQITLNDLIKLADTLQYWVAIGAVQIVLPSELLQNHTSELMDLPPVI
jgi:peptidoglycan/xylan/chitin deacetylase (PgdA/CDA1 family)